MNLGLCFSSCGPWSGLPSHLECPSSGRPPGFVPPPTSPSVSVPTSHKAPAQTQIPFREGTGVYTTRMDLVRLVEALFYDFKVGSAHSFISVHSDSCVHLPSLTFFFPIKALTQLTSLLEGFRARSHRACYQSCEVLQ